MNPHDPRHHWPESHPSSPFQPPAKRPTWGWIAGLISAQLLQLVSIVPVWAIAMGMGMGLGAPGGDRFQAWFTVLIELIITTPLYALLQLGAAIASWVAFFRRHRWPAIAISLGFALGGIPVLIAAYMFAYALSTITP